jgi:hypothetical protein
MKAAGPIRNMTECRDISHTDKCWLSLLQFTIIGLITMLVACSQHTNTCRYREGQVWSYKTRTGEEQSKLIIQKVVPNAKLGCVVFIAIDGLHIVRDHYTGTEIHSVSLIPFSQESLDRSTTVLLQEEVHRNLNADVMGPSFEDWKKSKGQTYRSTVLEFLNTLSHVNWPPTLNDTPLTIPQDQMPPVRPS